VDQEQRRDQPARLVRGPRPEWPRVVRGDWGRLAVPALGAWTPSMSVTVVIPAHGGQAALDLVLAALSAQTYPAGLLDVIVVDDGSQPPLRLPDIRPDRTHRIRVAAGWGTANAVNLGVEHASGAIVHRLDADMVVFPAHIEALARWHHVLPDAVTLGYKRFVTDATTTTPEQVRQRCVDGTIDRLFAESSPHDYIEKLIDKTSGLRAGDHLNFLVHVGATAAVRRDFFHAAGGLDPQLVLGEDTEFGFRLAQAGGVFIPDPAARSWHLGTPAMMREGPRLRRYNHPHLADLMPHPRWLRTGAGRIWRVPLVTAIVTGLADAQFELTRATIDRLLASRESDLRIVLIGPWTALSDARRDVLTDPLQDLRLIAANYRSEPRVRFAIVAPDTVFPSPYRLDVPAGVGVGRDTVGALIAAADTTRAGLVDAGRLTLWRTAAVSRAYRVQRAGESLVDAVASVHGRHQMAAPGVVDLATLDPHRLTPPAGLAAADTGPVLVGRIRSLLRAALLVARQQVARVYGRNR
jgi:GT2 family glycosyltransferase